MEHRFDPYRGQWIEVGGSKNTFYVPTEDEAHHLEFAAVNMAFEKQKRDGWLVVAVAGMPMDDDDDDDDDDEDNEDDEDDGEGIAEWQYEGLLAIKPATGEVMECDGGTNKVLSARLDTLVIEAVGRD